MPRYSKPARPAMTVDTATTFASAARCFRITEPKTPIEGVTEDLKGLCALALCGIVERYDVADEAIFDEASAYLRATEESDSD